MEEKVVSDFAKYKTNIISGFLAFIFIAAVASMSLLPFMSVYAAQLEDRSMQMSSSVSGATGVSYNTTFTTSAAAQSLIIDFCANSPILGDTCTAPTGMVTTGATASTGSNGAMGGWTVTTPSANQVRMSGGAAQAAGVQNFVIEGITNPTTTGTFYARVYTYTNNSFGTYASATSPGNYVDQGGLALAIVDVITVTARVQETLTFCIYTGADCNAGGSNVNLGDANGVLASATTVYTEESFFDLATNAVSGAVVRMKGTTLEAGANSFDVNATCTADSTADTVEFFGVRVTSGGAPLAPIAPYNCTAGQHALDTANTDTTYGQTIANTGGSPLSIEQGVVEFAGKASLTTPAGIYETTMTFVATATY